MKEENASIKRFNHFCSKVTDNDVFEFIQSNEKQYNVKQMCQALDVSDRAIMLRFKYEPLKNINPESEGK